ncbi:hypothetical protein RKK42_28225 [Klebsiella pneumoniae]|nr:hypothetical protein [Klebsiella pneumoniae]
MGGYRLAMVYPDWQHLAIVLARQTVDSPLFRWKSIQAASCGEASMLARRQPIVVIMGAVLHQDLRAPSGEGIALHDLPPAAWCAPADRIVHF